MSSGLVQRGSSFTLLNRARVLFQLIHPDLSVFFYPFHVEIGEPDKGWQHHLIFKTERCVMLIHISAPNPL
jgi:hypothetical protein